MVILNVVSLSITTFLLLSQVRKPILDTTMHKAHKPQWNTSGTSSSMYTVPRKAGHAMPCVHGRQLQAPSMQGHSPMDYDSTQSPCSSLGGTPHTLGMNRVHKGDYVHVYMHEDQWQCSFPFCGTDCTCMWSMEVTICTWQMMAAWLPYCQGFSPLLSISQAKVITSKLSLHHLANPDSWAYTISVWPG